MRRKKVETPRARVSRRIKTSASQALMRLTQAANNTREQIGSAIYPAMEFLC